MNDNTPSSPTYFEADRKWTPSPVYSDEFTISSDRSAVFMAIPGSQELISQHESRLDFIMLFSDFSVKDWQQTFDTYFRDVWLADDKESAKTYFSRLQDHSDTFLTVLNKLFDSSEEARKKAVEWFSRKSLPGVILPLQEGNVIVARKTTGKPFSISAADAWKYPAALRNSGLFPPSFNLQDCPENKEVKGSDNWAELTPDEFDTIELFKKASDLLERITELRKLPNNLSNPELARRFDRAAAGCFRSMGETLKYYEDYGSNIQFAERLEVLNGKYRFFERIYTQWLHKPEWTYEIDFIKRQLTTLEEYFKEQKPVEPPTEKQRNRWFALDTETGKVQSVAENSTLWQSLEKTRDPLRKEEDIPK